MQKLYLSHLDPFLQTDMYVLHICKVFSTIKDILKKKLRLDAFEIPTLVSLSPVSVKFNNRFLMHFKQLGFFTAVVLK